MNKKVEFNIESFADNKNIGFLTLNNPPVNSLSIDVIDNCLSWNSNLWKPNPVDVRGNVIGLSAPDASFCVALAADDASLNQLALST